MASIEERRAAAGEEWNMGKSFSRKTSKDWHYRERDRNARQGNKTSRPYRKAAAREQAAREAATAEE